MKFARFATSEMLPFSLFLPLPVTCTLEVLLYCLVWFCPERYLLNQGKEPATTQLARLRRRLHGSWISHDGVPHLSKGPRTLQVRGVAFFLQRQRGFRQR